MPFIDLKLFRFIIILICISIYDGLQAQTIDNILGIKTIVIDAGHGGKDAGAVSKDRRIKEKDIALSIALKFGNSIKNKYPAINVIYTRKTDVYIELDKRAAIANKNKADLFISIHINSTKATSPTGCETFVMGTHKSESNFEICKTENSVIALEDNYQSTYEGFDPNSPESYIIFSLLQNTHLEQSLKFASYIQNEYKKGPIKIDRGVKQGGLLVLWKATMPAVLTEVGFISNAKEATLLTKEQTQNSIANCLLRAFTQYKNDYESFHPVQKNPAFDSKSESEMKTGASEKRADAVEKREADITNVAAEGAEKIFRIQIFSISKVLPKKSSEFKGMENTYYIKVDKTYKYYIGEYSSMEKAMEELPRIKQKFKDAFIICTTTE